LPNPIAKMMQENTLDATMITKVLPPLDRNDGTTAHVHFKEVPGSKAHSIWVSAREDGRGAINMTPRGAKDGMLVRGLRPGKFYFWVTYTDAAGKVSKPSATASMELKDTFGEK
jgi:hypothetical protein